MKCRHCGKEYDESYSYCPYCAEPKPTPTQEVTIDEQIKQHNKFIWLEGLGMSIITFIPILILIYIILGVCLLADVFGAAEYNRELTFDLSWFEFGTVALISLGVSALVGLIYILGWFISSKRDKLIHVQFSNDTTSICPVCGNHSVALGRKGYDWNKGFWYRMFNIKGGHYLAGAESRRVTAHCQNCGHSWLTDEEWIK